MLLRNFTAKVKSGNTWVSVQMDFQNQRIFIYQVRIQLILLLLLIGIVQKKILGLKMLVAMYKKSNSVKSSNNRIKRARKSRGLGPRYRSAVYAER